MPWVRIDENAMDHPKFLVLSDGAWRLWCEGQAYCQKHLTNGHIPRTALRGFRYYSPARLRNLTNEFIVGKGPCWHNTPDGGVDVHDYLDWNDSRDTVIKARELAKGRRRRYNERNASSDAYHDADGTASVSRGVVCSDRDEATRGEGDPGKPSPSRERFERFWDAYPRKVGKEGAWREWQRLKPDDGFTVTAIAAVESQLKTEQWQRDHGQFIPHPRTWLHQGRWQDALEPPVRRVGAMPTYSDDWWEECKRLHDGTCEQPHWHRHKMRMEARNKANV